MEQDMTQGRPLPVIVKFVLPLFIGNVFQQLYNMVDAIIVGRFVGQKALAAVGSTGTIMFLLLGFAIGLTAGFTVLISQRFGAGDREGVRRSTANAVLLSLAATVILTLSSVAGMRTLLTIMNTPADIFDDAYAYITVIAWGTAAFVFYNLFSAILRAIGNSRVPLFFLVFAACLNVVLDLVLIIVFHMGAAGAALATDISQGVSAVLCLIYSWVKFPQLRPQRGFRFCREDSVFQLRVGLPMALQFAITASGTMVMQSAVNLFGSVAVAGYTAGNKVLYLLTQGFPALGQAMATFCGQNFGKGDPGRIRQGIRAGVRLSNGYAVVSGILSVALIRPALALFFSGAGDFNGALPWTRTYVIICAVLFIPLGLIYIYRNAMQGCGYGMLPMIGGVVELEARLGVALAAMAVMSYPLACFCDPAAWIAAGIFTGVSCRFVMKRVDRRFEGGPEV